MRIHCLENVDKSLTFLGEKAVKLENMGAHDIVDGNSRLTLGLIWTIILRFQVSQIPVLRVKSGQNTCVTSCQVLSFLCGIIRHITSIRVHGHMIHLYHVTL